MIKQYLFEKRKVSTIKKHELLAKFKTEPDEYFVKNTKEIGIANIPIIGNIEGEDVLISNPLDFDAVIKNEDEEMIFRVEPELNQQNMLEALLHTIIFLQLCDEDRKLLVTEVTKVLEENPKWAAKISGDKNDKMAALFGCHKETIKLIKRQMKAAATENQDSANSAAKQEVKGFKFSTDKQSLKFGNVNYQLKGKPSVEADKATYRFVNDESEIKIIIKSLKTVEEPVEG